MLLRTSPEGVICITQPCHAKVSGQLARAWGNEQFGQLAPVEELCLGAEQHDIGWLPWEKAPTLNLETGYPHRFAEVPTAVHVGLWSNAKHLAMSLGRYETLLVSLHGTGLYERFRSWESSPESTRLVQDFLKQEYTFQQELIAKLQQDSYYATYVTPEFVERNRQLVATWDALSLILCHGFQGEQQIERVPAASGETTLTLTALEDNSLQIMVSPWPFRLSEVTLVYEGRLLREQFTDEMTMQEALAEAPWVTLRNTLFPNSGN